MNVINLKETIRDLDTHDAVEAVTEYNMRLDQKKLEQVAKRNRGLGGLLRKRMESQTSNSAESSTVKSKILSPSQIVGEAPDAGSITSNQRNSKDGQPAPVKKKGGFFEWLEQGEKEREEMASRKMQRMNDIYMRKMQEKEKKAKEEEARKSNEI